MASSSAPPSGWKYDVFMSFRGPETRKTFADHLRAALIREGIPTVFRDDQDLKAGSEIFQQLTHFIESSRVSIIIFSKDYARSQWCLKELLKIMDCKRKGNEVIPIFYGVDPKEVRHQLGDYGQALVISEPRGENRGDTLSEMHREQVQRYREALTEASYLSGLHLTDRKGNEVIPIFYGVDPKEVRHQLGDYGQALVISEPRGENRGDTLSEMHREQVQRYREALTEASYLSGLHLTDSYETKFISDIVKKVLLVVCPRKLEVADHPVSVEIRRDEIISIHESSGSDDVYMIGIYGMGGIGKTEAAKSIYNYHLKNFEYSCFLANVREESKVHRGLLHLQNQFLSSMHIKNVEKKNFNVDQGKNLIKQRCCEEKILLVIDDASELNQIKCIAGNRSWFGAGSLIIITTRDKELLLQINVSLAYPARVLTDDDSMNLFSWHAFGSRYPPPHYVELARKLIAYAGGLPLALEVLGSYLYTKNTSEWTSLIAKLQRLPNASIQEKLKISFETLEDDQVKGIFLHIACFLIGMDKNYVIDILDGCGYDTIIGISSLKFRCLLTTNAYGEIGMHDLLRDMAREIVRQEFPGQPGMRTRLCFREDVQDVLMNSKGTHYIEGIGITQPSERKLDVHDVAFVNMQNLRLLQMENISITISLTPIDLNQLRWICWPFCSWKSLPHNFGLRGLIVLDMQHSQIHHLWSGISELRSLKTLNLSYSIYLAETPNFTCSSQLENIILEGCKRLSRVHRSIQELKMLSILNLKDCVKLTHLPSSVYSLWGLNIEGCLSLKREREPEPLPSTSSNKSKEGNNESQSSTSSNKSKEQKKQSKARKFRCIIL